MRNNINANQALLEANERLRQERLKRQQAEKKLKGLLEGILDAVVIVNAEGRIVLLNSHTEALFGYGRQELLGKTVEVLVPRRFRGMHTAQRDAYVAQPSTRSMESGLDLWGLHKDGREFPVEVSLSPLHADEGFFVLATIRDITERKRMQETMRESARRFRAIFDQTYQFIGLLKPDGTLLEINQPALDFVGAKPADVIGRPFWDTPWSIFGQGREHLRSAVAEAAKGKFVRYEAKHPGADGKLRTIDFSLKPVMNESGAVILIIPEGRDVTERKQVEIALRRARQELAEANAQLRQTLHKLQEDEAAGRHMQFQLLPKTGKVYGDYTCSHCLLTSAYLSGDFVDYFSIDAEHLGFYMADVSGHGLPSALVTVLLKSHMTHYLEAYHHDGDETILEPAETLQRLNRDLLRNRLGRYLTIFYGVLSRHGSLLRYSNGGQFPFPILFDGARANYISCKSLPIGLFEIAQYRTDTLRLTPSFILVLISDGILELLPQSSLPEKQAFLLSLINSLEVCVPSLIQGLGLEAGSSRPDDITLLLIKRQI